MPSHTTDCDVLVCHGPDDNGDEWVSHFVEDLTTYLARELRRDCRVETVASPGGDTLSDEAQALLEQAALMVVVVSESNGGHNQQEIDFFSARP